MPQIIPIKDLKKYIRDFRDVSQDKGAYLCYKKMVMAIWSL